MKENEVSYNMKKVTNIDISQTSEFSNVIQESIIKNRKVKIFEFNEIKGIIKNIDMINRKIKIEFEDEDFDWIKLDDITDIILI